MGCECIQRRKSQHDQRARRDKQKPGGEPSPHPVQTPANIRRKLLRLWPGEKMAKVQGMEKVRLGNPLAIVDQVLVHQRNLPCRTAKVDQANPSKGPHERREIWLGRTFRHFDQMPWFEQLVDTRKGRRSQFLKGK